MREWRRESGVERGRVDRIKVAVQDKAVRSVIESK